MFCLILPAYALCRDKGTFGIGLWLGEGGTRTILVSELQGLTSRSECATFDLSAPFGFVGRTARKSQLVPLHEFATLSPSAASD